MDALVRGCSRAASATTYSEAQTRDRNRYGSRASGPAEARWQTGRPEHARRLGIVKLSWNLLLIQLCAMPDPESETPRVILGAALGVALFGAFLRLHALGSDPIHPVWKGWTLDEGRWTELPREWVLFGQADPDTSVSVMHLLLSPLYQAVTAGVFEVVGVDFVSSRLPSALAGVALLALVFFGLRSHLRPVAWLTTVILVALDPEIVYYSRVAIPEMTALVLHAAAFLLLVSKPRSTARALVAGLLTSLGLMAKVTTAPALPAFIAAIWIARRPDDPSSPPMRTGALVAGVAAPALMGALLVALAGLLSPAAVAPLDAMRDILRFVQVNSPYRLLATFYAGHAAAQINYLLVAAWPLTIVLLMRRVPPTKSRELLLGGLAWTGAWVICWGGLAYFPGRWVMLVHLPLAIVIGAGVSLLAEPGQGSLADWTPKLSPAVRWIIGSLMVVPLAAVLAPSIVATLDLAGIRLERLRHHLTVIAALSMVGGHLLARTRAGTVAAVIVVVLPLAAAIAWRLVHGPGSGVYWSVEGEYVAASRAIILLVAGVSAVAFGLATRCRTWSDRLRWSIVAYAVALGLAWATTDHLPSALNRSHVASAIAGSVSSHENQGRAIGVSRSSTLLTPTTAKYRELFSARSMPSMVLVAAWTEFDTPSTFQDFQNYRLAREFEIPGFPRRRVGTVGTTTVRLYLRAGDESPSGSMAPR